MRLSHILTTEEQYRAILRNHLPAGAVDWAYHYFDLHKVHFHITRRRTSKLGDYRWPRDGHPYHEISVNGDLAPHLFLWVLLHEAAHLENRLHHPEAQPHGHEWQKEYRRLLSTHIALFPPDTQPLIARLTRRIPLNHSLMHQVEDLLRRGGTGHAGITFLDDLPAGSRFRLPSHPDLLFVSISRRRTRWLCRELASGRSYTVNASAEVLPE